MHCKAEIEYRVRPVTRYIVTSFRRAENTGASKQHGEFDNEETAYAVGYALAKAEHERLGWPIGDERIQYPRRPSEENAVLSEANRQPHAGHSFEYPGGKVLGTPGGLIAID